MPSTLRSGAVPRPLALALSALNKIAEEAALSCHACKEMKAELASGRRPDPRIERDHRRLCPGVHAWPALAQIAWPIAWPPPDGTPAPE